MQGLIQLLLAEGSFHVRDRDVSDTEGPHNDKHEIALHTPTVLRIECRNGTLMFVSERPDVGWAVSTFRLHCKTHIQRLSQGAPFNYILKEAARD